MEIWNVINYLYLENTLIKQKYDNLISHLIPEIIGMKTRIETFERKENEKNVTQDVIVTDLINQKINVQKKLSEVEKSINYLNIQLEENKEPKKSEEKEDEIKICKFNRMGFCRERQNCPYFHATKVCREYFNSGVCSKQRCCERHPRKCIYFDRGECQWDSQCKYLHKGITSAVAQHRLRPNKLNWTQN